MTKELETVRIHAIAFGGDGVGKRENNKTVFVPFTAIGDLVSIRIIEDKKRFSRGLLVELLEASDERQDAPCPYYSQCDGCQYQHIKDELEYDLKADQLKSLFQRIGKIDIPEIEQPVDSQKYWHYRNKVTLHQNQGRLAYRMIDKNKLIDIDQCLIADNAINDYLQNTKITVDDVLIRKGVDEKVFHSSKRGQYDYRFINEELNGQAIEVPIGSFYQVNPEVLNEIIKWLKASLSEIKTLIDCYCGVGVFSLVFHDIAEQCVGGSLALSMPM